MDKYPGMRIQTAIMQTLAMVGGATSSVFPQVEALLIGDTDYADALQYVSSQKKTDGYHSMVDFLFCELHTEWRLPCRKFYMGGGPQLKELITPAKLFEYNKQLLIALEVAHSCMSEQRKKNWGWFKLWVEEAVRAA